MEFAALIERISALACIEGRAARARELAGDLGATDLVLLVEDSGTGTLLPAAGFRKTLPGGGAWRDFVNQCAAPGVYRARLPWPAVATPALGCRAPGILAVVLGGELADDAAQRLVSALPLLAAALQAQQELGIARGELGAARGELSQSASLMKALDDARRQVDCTLVELDAQARTLEAARHRAEEATRAKDQFLAMLGHELRNPLAPIVTTLELLHRRGRWSPDHDVIRRQVDHMMRLVDDLLDVARIAGGKLSLDLKALALDEVIGRALESVAPLLGAQPRAIRVDVEPAMVVDGDADRLAQVFANLLTNALKYSDAGTPVEVTARRSADGSTATVEVVDRGIGIEPDQLESVFDLFEQQGRGIDRAQGGLGLGLAIVRNLVQLHGGRVRAHSDGAGCGSRFTVELPLLQACPVPVLCPVETHAHPVGQGRVLVVDDNTDALVTLAMALELSGYQVRTASDGAAALAVAASFQPHAAVLDIGLPGMSGYELAPRLQEAVRHRLQLVAVTGYGQPGDRLRTTEAGFHEHLVKPVDIASLCAVLSRVGAAAEAVQFAGSAH